MARIHKSKTNQNTFYSHLALNLVSSKWTLLVLHALQHKVLRYSEITRVIDGVTQKMLTDTLRRLERDGIVERIVYPIFPPKVEYKLTELGCGLLKVTETMAQWAEDHYGDIQQARYKYDSRPPTGA